MGLSIRSSDWMCGAGDGHESFGNCRAEHGAPSETVDAQYPSLLESCYLLLRTCGKLSIDKKLFLSVWVLIHVSVF